MREFLSDNEIAVRRPQHPGQRGRTRRARDAHRGARRAPALLARPPHRRLRPGGARGARARLPGERRRDRAARQLARGVPGRDGSSTPATTSRPACRRCSHASPRRSTSTTPRATAPYRLGMHDGLRFAEDAIADLLRRHGHRGRDRRPARRRLTRGRRGRRAGARRPPGDRGSDPRLLLPLRQQRAGGGGGAVHRRRDRRLRARGGDDRRLRARSRPTIAVGLEHTFAATSHHVSNIQITFDGPDQRALRDAISTPGIATSTARPTASSGARYRHRFVRTDAGWRICELLPRGGGHGRLPPRDDAPDRPPLSTARRPRRLPDSVAVARPAGGGGAAAFVSRSMAVVVCEEAGEEGVADGVVAPAAGVDGEVGCGDDVAVFVVDRCGDRAEAVFEFLVDECPALAADADAARCGACRGW